MRDLGVFPQAVQLDAVAVVYVDVLFLRDGKVLVVVQPLDVPDHLAQLQLAAQLALAPVHGRDVALSACQQQLPPVPRVLACIRS